MLERHERFPNQRYVQKSTKKTRFVFPKNCGRSFSYQRCSRKMTRLKEDDYRYLPVLLHKYEGTNGTTEGCIHFPLLLGPPAAKPTLLPVVVGPPNH